MKVALVFFYSDNTLLIRKQSQCVLRSSFEQGKEVEVKCEGCPYVALILRMADSAQALEVALKKGLEIIENCSKSKEPDCDHSEWQSKLVDNLMTSLPVTITATLPEEHSSKGRKRKAVDYKIIDSPSDDNDVQRVTVDSTSTTSGNKSTSNTSKKKSAERTNKKVESQSKNNKKKKTASKPNSASTKSKSGNDEGTSARNDSKKTKKQPIPIPDVTVDDDEAFNIFENEAMDLTKDVPGFWTGVSPSSSSLNTSTDKGQASSKTQSTAAKANKPSKNSTGIQGATASKEPKTSLPCPRPICKDKHRELATLKEKYGALEAKYKKVLNELEESRKHPQRCEGDVVQPGKVPPEIAAEKKMIELIGGSGVYIYKSQLAMCKSSCKSRSSLACQLLKVFFTEQELLHGKLSKRSGGDFQVLDQQIINVIKAYCSSTSFKHLKEEDVKKGHKKGLMHAMNLSIKQFQRRANKRKNDSLNVNKKHAEVEVDDDEESNESSSSEDET